MDALLAQDWVTIRGSSTVVSLTQPEPDWLDLMLYQDLVVWLDVKEFTPTSTNIPTFLYQTAPSKDDALFFNMATVQVQTGVTTTVLLKDAMPVTAPPCGRWFRWLVFVTGGVAWDLTFRIWVAANRVGNRIAISEATTLADLEGEGYRYAYGQYPPPGTNTGSGGGSQNNGLGGQIGMGGWFGTGVASQGGPGSGQTPWPKTHNPLTGF